MRRQELIYAQNSGFVRNRDMFNINTSSDVCTFTMPYFEMTGATLMVSGMTSGNTGIHLIENNEEVNLIFEFSGNAMGNDTIFSYEIFKFNDKSQVFTMPYIFKSSGETYNTFNSSNVLNYEIPSTNLTDGEYIIKPIYNHRVCTDIFNRMGLRNLSNTFTSEGEFNLYNPLYDYYFAAISTARTPIFDLTPSTNDNPIGSLNVITIIPDGSGQTSFNIEQSFNGSPIITLNGLVLAVDEDYTLSGNIFTLVETTLPDDILTVVFVGMGSTNGLVSQSEVITYSIPQGPTDYQGDEVVYFNTTTNKYEFYLINEPINGNDIMISVNGAVLLNKIDYYQSLTNKKRIIFEGNLFVNDVITVVYNGKASYVGNITDAFINVYWTIDIPPQKNNGKFILQLSTDKDFTNIISSGETNYVVGNRVYSNTLTILGNVGDKRYYRVINEKNYITILGDVITTINSSEVIPIIIQTNSINNY